MTRDELVRLMQVSAAAKPRAIEIKGTDGWGIIHIRDITVGEVEDQVADKSDKGDKHRLARAAARVISDEQGNRLFDPNNEADVALLASQPWRLLRQVDAADDSGN